MTMNTIWFFVAFAAYLLMMVTIGAFYMKRNKDADDYFLGGRGLGGWVAALSAQASDMSGWLLMGLPGSVYALGTGQAWIAVGLFIGTVLNWYVISARLRRYTIRANNSVTFPEYLENRFHDKKKILLLPSRMKIPFLSNAAAAELLENKSSLNEIMQFLAEQFELWTNSVGCFTGENVMDEVLYYIQQNYDQRLSLEILAPIFGYNSSYLGKLFRKTTGIGFNAYLDQVRIGAAKQLLVQENLKNYEIAGKVGYRGVDYFHKKFKKYTGTTPAEYRRRETGEN